MVFSINYDLKKPGSDYDGLHQAIKSLGTWWHYLDSTWLVSTTMSASQLNDRLKPHLDSNDFMLILEAGTDYAGWLPEKAWQWIRSQAALN